MSSDPSTSPSSGGKKSIFIVHGRDTEKRNELFLFLEAIGLEPMDWDSEKEGASYVLEVVRKGISSAWATIVIWSPEERVHLLPPYGRKELDYSHSNQPRPNVILEAGMALAIMPEKVIFLEFGEVRSMSDLGGVAVRKSPDAKLDRAALVRELINIGCEINSSWKPSKSARRFSHIRAIPKKHLPPILLEECRSVPCYGFWSAVEGGQGTFLIF